MYTTQNNRQIEKQLDREEEGKLQIDRCIQHRTIDRQSRVYSIEHQIDRVIVTQRGRGGSLIQMYATKKNRQIEKQLDREEEEEDATDRCTQHRTIDREEGEVGTDRCIQHRKIDREEEEVATDRCIQHRTIDRQRDSQIERRRGSYRQIDVYNTEQ